MIVNPGGYSLPVIIVAKAIVAFQLDSALTTSTFATFNLWPLQWLKGQLKYLILINDSSAVLRILLLNEILYWKTRKNSQIMKHGVLEQSNAFDWREEGEVEVL